MATAAGDFDAARADVLDALEVPGDDPWSAYPLGQRDRWRDLFEELREEIH